ncbi:hypothetical protein MGG_12547 [Pyricularia oryzae 70-15]|uniref:Uncharacterized protein n=1 Tax=Pyricularia oryzae (strain 70-15 / ATCC MYA-4617 / FGSC 8958) TaxID=242507 RepID=G4NL34_PYRO7|nr:uncharacterized protein MGG_12547 [Pyricularia oryzae 70-15]EHA45967.1 hypothetical protein MGG_12547 [Pyricularia oryzae 70-15]
MRVISLSTLNSPPLDSDSEPEHDINNTTLLFGPKAARLVILKPLPPPRLPPFDTITRQDYQNRASFLSLPALTIMRGRQISWAGETFALPPPPTGTGIPTPT